jgi:hypothetical protein
MGGVNTDLRRCEQPWSQTATRPGSRLSNWRRQDTCGLTHDVPPGVVSRAGLRLPPQAARAAGTPGTRPGRWINRAKRTTRPGRSTPRRGASQPRFLRPTGPTRGHNQRERPFRPTRGTRVACVGISVGAKGLDHRGTGPNRQGCGACQRSSTRRRRVPHLPPTVAGAAGSRAGRQGRMSGTPPPRRSPRRPHSPLTAGHRAPSAPRAFRRAWWPACRGETSHGLWLSTVRCRWTAGDRRHRLGRGAGRCRGVSGRCRRSCRWCRPLRWPGCPDARTGPGWGSAR